MIQSLILMILPLFSASSTASKINLTGAWERQSDTDRLVWICSDKHFAATVYNLKEKRFVGTCGGTWSTSGDEFVEVHEFNTIKPDLVGKEIRTRISEKGGQIVLMVDGKPETWTRIDNGTPGMLAGAWLITGRSANGEMEKVTPGARRTMKILSGTRFQWIAYNTDTKEFFGTGGGTYTTRDGKYTETIEFFSRDASRVGMSLQFDYALDNGDWRHKGLSSKGDPIDEVWSKREKIGL